MRRGIDSPDRRTVLRALLTSGTIGLAGCSDSRGNEQSNPITHVGVTDTSLVVEFEADQSIDRITVIQPDGESFANQTVTPGSTRETIDIRAQYPPGEYIIHVLDGEDTIGEQTITINPDVQITDLKLGRNYPEEMYEGAGNSTVRSEVIVTVENNGTGPDAITQLRFEGDVPQPTDKESDKSDIYEASSEVGGEPNQVVIPPEESKTIYSTSRPFTSASSNVSCTPEGEQGQFTAIAQLRIGQTLHRRYDVEYTGEELIDCSITISEVDQ